MDEQNAVHLQGFKDLTYYNDDDGFHENTEESDYLWQLEVGETEGAEVQEQSQKKVSFENDEKSLDLTQLSTKDKPTRRNSLYELDSFTKSNFVERSSEDIEEIKTKALIRFFDSLGKSEVARIRLSPLTQKFLGCVVDENVATEHPWITINKELIQDNLDLHSDSSDFLPIIDSIQSYPEQQLLLAYAPTAIDNNVFYICLTQKSYGAATHYIESRRLEQQQCVMSAVQKIPKYWQPLGSADFIRESFIKKSRLLYEVEVNLYYSYIQMNSAWDMYQNDYAKLVAFGNLTKASMISIKGYKERQNFYNGQLSQGCLINDVTWHPQWTGIMAAAYTTISKSENLSTRMVLNLKYNHASQVLLWSFDDCLKPKLILESKREVTTVSFCPTNGNIIVGGCINGQIVIWDITGKIEEVEMIIVQTSAQAKYQTFMKSLSTWMKEARSSSILRPTATSSLQLSQKGPITKIKWLSPYNKLDDRGILHELPENTDEKNLSLQFISSCEDGSIAFWDLNWRPSTDQRKKKENKERKKNTKKPQSLIQSISPFKILDVIFKPLYLLIVQNPNETHNAIITSMTYPKPDIKKEQMAPIIQSDDIITRRYYKVVMKKQNKICGAKIFVGTARGDCGVLSWDGYEFSTGVTLNKEVCKWVWVKQIHDGPVCHVSRSRHLKDLILTVGGRIFAVWREDFEIPIIWRKSQYRYTACSWDSNRPTVFILGRNDGTVETWDMFIKSHEPNIIESMSGRIITGIYTHELPLNPQCIAFCDYNGALRIFLTPDVLFESKQNNANWMRQFIDREVEKDRTYSYKNECNFISNEHIVEKSGLHNVTEKKEEVETKEKLLEEEAKIEAIRNSKKNARKTLIDKLRARWVTREMNRMQQVILEKKGLNEEELERRREPILRIKREAHDKETKRQYIIETADKLFLNVVGSNFPHYNKKLLSLNQGFGDAVSVETTTISNVIIKLNFSLYSINVKSEEKIIHNYGEIESKALLLIQQNSDKLNFSWEKLINEGMHRKRSIDFNVEAHEVRLNSIDEVENE
ncbi:PREDICTED: WD repeat-containing protein 63-like [Ceratosolen solmsi marchali]|uniref:WD repeat-containing protein 63-like n=1 Tax=Ceratosolen solmsi marchali TaxID=326594 RepID=A0AAJ6YSZ5_9HYME|nr:PREDICTED: WD repeat-containing protein 63-like [Ceratosolen solmsi marchali]